MRVKRSIATDGNLCPAAVNVLGRIPPEVSFHVLQHLRHPESIYQFSLEKVGETFCNVARGYLLKAAEYRNHTSAAFDISHLLRDQESFLRAMQDHLDDCWSILKTFIDPSTARKQSSFAEEYVIENKLAGAKSFRDAVAGYKTSLFITNKLKHGQGRLRGIAIWLPTGPNLGYFLEEPDSHGIIGASTAIHPDRGAFSFARDLRQHLANVYRCSEQLVKTIKRALSVNGKQIVHQPTSTTPRWTEVLALAAQLPAAYFPKELKRGVAGFHLGADSQTLEIRSPEHPRIEFPAIVNSTCSTVVDGHSPRFKVPIP